MFVISPSCEFDQACYKRMMLLFLFILFYSSSACLGQRSNNRNNNSSSIGGNVLPQRSSQRLLGSSPEADISPFDRLDQADFRSSAQYNFDPTTNATLLADTTPQELINILCGLGRMNTF